MHGWSAATTDAATEQDLSDRFTVDGHAEALYAAGAGRDGIVGRSWRLLDADLYLHEVALPIDGYRQSGWLASA